MTGCWVADFKLYLRKISSDTNFPLTWPNMLIHILKLILKQQILTENPVPDNLDQVKKSDDFVCNILKDERKQKNLDMDSRFE